ncbi:MAG TPA: carbohydrate ABC transporter permease, partial [Actinomycetota bacterium]|nr:carbohydrate ABC transporter permease [Actinomycetota bacterium]
MKRREGPWTILGATLIILWALAPVVWIFSLSFKAGDDINNNRFWPTSFSTENYETVFNTPLFTSALRNSIGISLLATVLSVAIATVAAYAIARLDFPGKRAVLSIALAIAMFPAVSLVG